MKRLWLDFETFSTVPIRSGVHAYAEQAEIMLWAYGLDNGPAKVWDATTAEPMPD